jgi:hypothetical protein
MNPPYHGHYEKKEEEEEKKEERIKGYNTDMLS